MALGEFTIRLGDPQPDPQTYKFDNGMFGTVRVDAETITFLGTRNPIAANLGGGTRTGEQVRAATGAGVGNQIGARARGVLLRATIPLENAQGVRGERVVEKTVTVFTPEAFNGPDLQLGAIFPGIVLFDTPPVNGVPGSNNVSVAVNFTVAARFPEVR